MIGMTDSPLKIGVIASFTAEPLRHHINQIFKQKNVTKCSVEFAPFNQIHQTCYGIETAFEQTPDVIVLLWRLEDLIDSSVTAENIKETLHNLVSAIKYLRQHFKGTIIINNIIRPWLSRHDSTSIEQKSAFLAQSENAQILANQLIGNIDDILVLDILSLMLKIGCDKAHDLRKWYLYRQPWSEVFWSLISNQTARLITAQKRSAKKCIILDADNTLWGGVIGEDGIGGINIGNDFPGNTYRDFQKQLLTLQQKGILLAIASKNNEEDVFEVLDKHDAIILKREHFVAFEINWQSKAVSIQNIAKKLNIGIDSLVFIDDNPKEIAEVQSLNPSVTCILVPDEITSLPTIFNGLDLFDNLTVTDEDLNRTSLVRSEDIRKQAEVTMTAEEFLSSLELEVAVFKADEEHLGRITQLINKTNQFNLTTLRRTADEVKTLWQSPNTLILGMNLKDRFGDYGLVGVAILKIEKETAILDTFLMSCRALGRGAEEEFLKQAINISACSKIIGNFQPTLKNQLAKDFLQSQGFHFDNSKNIYVFCK
jgi:FkbH-like protein